MHTKRSVLKAVCSMSGGPARVLGLIESSKLCPEPSPSDKPDRTVKHPERYLYPFTIGAVMVYVKKAR